MKKYYLATNEIDVFNYGEMQQGQDIMSGQKKLFENITLEELKIKLASYGQTYEDNNNIQ